MKALIYTRVASKKQAEASGPIRQEDNCRAYCERNGLEVVGVWHEVGSAGQGWEELPILADLVRNVLPQHQPAVLVAEDHGRFTQAGIDDGNSLDAAVRASGGRIASSQDDDPVMRAQMHKLFEAFKAAMDAERRSKPDGDE